MSRKVTTISDRVAMERCLRNMVKDQLKQIKELKAENAQLQQQLKDNTKQVCEKIREKLSSHCDYKDNIGWYMPENKFNLILDQLENEKKESN